MLIIKVRRRIVFIAIVLLIAFLLSMSFFLKISSYKKTLMCQAEAKIKLTGNNNNDIRKEYNVYFYLNDKNRALVLVNGIYIGEDGVPLTIRRVFSFDAIWSSYHLVVRNIAIDKNINDNAPDNAIPILGENDVIKIEMLTKYTYLISTVQSKMACNIRN
ncbi:FidL [Brenneria roseae subsp. americana]|uniref:FidL n=1 Tax=Brenneria roseae subsp. americana TaxID=1508507 RepID=A0A2U1TZK4_9GAMM|nr:FidL [Brenneria roseae]PWC14847.1 FidL [Brenneria roseae subsp. americana]